MARLKPKTKRSLEQLATELHRIADDLEPARPFLADLYHNLAEEMVSALTVPDAPFRIKLPDGATHNSVAGEMISIYPPNFDSRKYHERLIRGMSSG